MKYFWTSLAIIAVVIAIILVGRSQWFKDLLNPKPKEGTSCLDDNKNPGIITNGACKPTPPPPPPPLGERMQRMPINAPEKFVQFRGRFCLPTITIPQYPGFIYILEKTDKFYCYYRRGIVINFPSIQSGLFIPASADRQIAPGQISDPLYNLCGSITFILPIDLDPVKAKNFINELKAEFQHMYNDGLKIILKVILTPNVYAPGSLLTLSVYAVDCNSGWAQKSVTYINSIH